MSERRKWAAVAVALMMVLLAGCQVGISRNTDGSLRVEAAMSEGQIAKEVERAISDPLVEQVSVDARQGYLYVEAERRRPGSEQRDSLSFHLTLGVKDGHLSAVVSDLNLSGFQVDDDRLEAWNQRLSENLERAGRERERSELVDVVVGPDDVTMVWRVESDRR